MTENEAIKCLEKQIKIQPCGNVALALEISMKAIEEIQQYRAIGTIDEFKALKEHMQIIKEAYENTDGYKDGYAKAIDEFAERLKNSLLHNYRHLLTVDTDGFEWLTTDAVGTHIDEIEEQMKGGGSDIKES